MSNKTNTPKDTHYANLRRAFRDEKSGGAPAFKPRQPVPPGENAADGLVRLYGLHTVRAALDNPRRKIRKMLVTRNAAERLEIADLAALHFKAELVEPRDIDKITGSDAVHQGVLIEAEPLKPKRLDALGDFQASAGARPGHRSAQCRRHPALGGGFRRRRADHHGAPQPAGIGRAGEIRLRRTGAYRPDRGEEPGRRARPITRGRLSHDRA